MEIKTPISSDEAKNVKEMEFLMSRSETVTVTGRLVKFSVRIGMGVACKSTEQQTITQKDAKVSLEKVSAGFLQRPAGCGCFMGNGQIRCVGFQYSSSFFSSS